MSEKCHLIALLTLATACAESPHPTTVDPLPDADADTGAAAPTWEPGCITVDGGGGYAWISDALDAASPGSIVQLCESEGHVESVTIDKPVTLMGPGADAFTLTPPAGQDGIVILAAGTTLQGLSVSGGRRGIVIREDGVALQNVSVAAHAEFGIDIEGASDVSIRGAIFMLNAAGGLRISNGNVAMMGGVFQSNRTQAILVEDGSSLSAESLVVQDTLFETDGGEDGGNGVLVKGDSRFTSVNSIFRDSASANVRSSLSDLSLSGDSLTGGLYGVYAVGGSHILDGLSVEDAYNIGVWVQTEDEVSLSNLRVSGDPRTTSNTDGEDWWSSTSTKMGIGVRLDVEDAEVSDSVVEGYNNAGLYARPYGSTGGWITVNNSTFQNNGRHGVVAFRINLLANNLSVLNLQEIDVASVGRCADTIHTAAAAVVSAEAVFTGGTFIDNQGYGISSNWSDLRVDGATFARNLCSSVTNFEGSLDITNSDFEEAGPSYLNASVSMYGSTLGSSISHSRFHGSNVTATTSASYDYGDVERLDTTTGPQGYDIYAYSSTGVEVTSNTFEDGTIGVDSYFSDTRVEDNTFHNYAQGAVYQTRGTLLAEDNSITGFNAYGYYCYVGLIEVDGGSIQEGSPTEYQYKTYYDGELYASYTKSTHVDAIVSDACGATVSNVDIRDVTGAGVVGKSSAAGPTTISSVTLENVAQSDAVHDAALSFYHTGVETTVTLSGVEVNGSNGAGLEFATNLSRNDGMNLNVDGLILSGIAGAGIELQGTAVVASIRGAMVESAGSHGLWSDDIASLTLTESTFRSNGASGALLSATTGSVSDNTLTGNAQYGLVCEVDALTLCSGNDLSGNTLGELSGCELSCADL